VRIEIVANLTIEENIMDELRTEGVAKFYTKLPSVSGVGRQGPRMGDSVWPEENFIMVVWCGMDEALGIERAVNRVKKDFPNEGIKLFGLHEIYANDKLL
jgi:hypothetical protein